MSIKLKSLLPRIDFKPEDQTPITLFSNWGEAVVFWLSITGLIFLVILSVIRYFSVRQIDLDYRDLEKTQDTLVLKIEEVEQENRAYLQKIDSIDFILQYSQNEIDQLKSEINLLKKEGLSSPVKTEIPARQPDKSKKNILEWFQVKKP
jgi:hypothetical protein